VACLAAPKDWAATQPPQVAKFPKSVRLLKHADFKRVYENGKRQFSGNLTVFFLLTPAERNDGSPGPRVGITVGRALGGAVQRNRIKRRMREAVRSRVELLERARVDVVINPKKSVLAVELAALSVEVGRAFEAVTRRLTERAAGKSE
jgi:ribonuclease P protein component